MNLPKLKMEGRSGCNLVVEYQHARPVIKKYSSSIAYNERLLKQAEKQQTFFNNNIINTVFATPNIMQIGTPADDLAWFTMPYVFAQKYSDYLDGISYREVHDLLAHIISYFTAAFKSGERRKVDANIFFLKIEQLRKSIAANQIVNYNDFDFAIRYLENNIPLELLHHGTCHGDFTFSNILFGDDKIYLLDFLDSFIDSPLLDIVKLRQDTCFKWSVMVEGNIPQYRINKITQIFNYFDGAIAAYCNELQLSEWYHYLQVLNLLRIAPYLSKNHEVLFIENSLKKLLK
jgi:thiamine kinase-like enzyme